MALFLASSVSLLAAPSCHTSGDGCPDNALPAGVRFEVTITGVVSSSGCTAPTALIGDTQIHVTDEPQNFLPDEVCKVETMRPPEGVDTLHGVDLTRGFCRDDLVGFRCQGPMSTCPTQEGSLSVGVSLGSPATTKPGDERDATYSVDLYGPETKDCPSVSCRELFTTHVKRLN